MLTHEWMNEWMNECDDNNEWKEMREWVTEWMSIYKWTRAIWPIQHHWKESSVKYSTEYFMKQNHIFHCLSMESVVFFHGKHCMVGSQLSNIRIKDQICDLLGSHLWSEQISDLRSSDIHPRKLDWANGTLNRKSMHHFQGFMGRLLKNLLHHYFKLQRNLMRTLGGLLTG